MTYFQQKTSDLFNDIEFGDLFIIEDLQRLQDLFSDATGVASIIVYPDGTHITRPSNFCTLCESFIGKTETGLAKYFISSDTIRDHSSSNLVIKPYMIGGLWGAGAGISVGGKHVANWLIGQVRNPETNENLIMEYADEIGANRVAFMQALGEVPVMSEKQFNKVSEMLFAFVIELSEKAYNNLLLKMEVTAREKDAHVLRETEENLSTTLHSIGDAVLSTDKNGLIVNINTKASTLCGWSKADALGKSLNEVFNIVNSDTREVVVDPVKKVLETGQIIGLANHTVLISKEGIEYQIANSAAPVKNKDGEINGVVLVFSDVTEKYKTEKALWESERSKSVLLSNIPGMAYRCRFDTEWTMEFVSEGVFNLTGYKAEDILLNRTISFNDMIQPEYRDHLWKAWEKAIHFHETVHEEYKIRTADNHEKWVWEQGTPVYNHAGEVEALEGLILDITERKMSEETLHNERMLLRTIIDNIPDAIYTKDLSCLKTLANKTEVRYSGANSEAEVLGRSDFEFYTKELAEKFFADDQEVIQTGIPVIDREDYIYDENHQKRWLLSSKIPLREKEGRIIGIVGIGHDITERKHAEETIGESEALYRNLVEKLPDGVYKSTHDGKFVDVNPAMAKMLGYASKEELMAIDIKTQLYFEPTDRVSLVLQENNEELGIYRLRKKDGSGIWVEDKGWYNLDESGEILFHEGVMRDITERKVVELALQESEALYRNLVERLPDGVYKSTHKGKFVDVNPAMFRMLGYDSKEELLKIDIKTQLYFEPSDRESIILQEQLEEMGVYRLKKQDGTEIWVEDHGWYNQDENGEIITHEGIMRDITERKLADEALQKSEQFLKETQLIAKLGSYSLDFVSHTWTSSEVLDTIFGIDQETDKTLVVWESIIHPEWRNIIREYLITNVIGRKQDFDKVYKIIRLNDQSERWVHGMGQLKFDNKDQPVLMLGTIRDITELKNSELELLKAKEKAEESDKLKSAFLANMSHEIRTPMNGILGFAELLKSPGLSGEEQQEYIRIIKKSGERMLNIINDIVDISKIEAGQVKVFFSETNINEQTEFLHLFFTPEVEKKGVQLILRNGLPGNEAIIKTDKEKVYAVLTNLIKNAIKFTKTGSIEIGYVKKGFFLEYYVKDTGYGIRADRQHAIFDRFVQADIADTRAFQGAGLGLSISRAYVEMLGGTIWVESEEGHGSTFYFTIPFNAESEQKNLVPDSRIYEDNSRNKKLKILIVEDDETSELLISIAVRSYSKEILKVRTGGDAIETCRANPDIDLILMDIKMPEMDGYEATRQIRLFNKNVYIVAQTAFGLVDEKEKALASGCNDYISKPLDIALLKGLINNYLTLYK